MSRLQHLVAEYAKDILNEDPNRAAIPYWNGTQWQIGILQFVYSYSSSINFLINQAMTSIYVHFQNQNISMNYQIVHIYDNNMNLLWDSSNSSNIRSDNTEIVPIVDGQLQWQIWSESSKIISLSVVISSSPLEQLNLTNDETLYLWYRRNVTLK